MASEDLKKAIDELLKKKTKRIVTGTVRTGRRTDILTVGKQGRYIRYRAPKGGDVSDIALLPTIKSAILHSKGGKIQVRKRDYKEKVRRRKISTLICLVLDTSSSMVMDAKMRGIKDALNEMMLDAYQKRDRISLVIAYGRSADVVLPFTGSVEKGQQFIDQIQFGGTTPLAAGLRRGLENLRSKIRIEKDTNPLLVVVTDGIANTPLVPGEDVTGELRETCAIIERTGIPTLIIDVSIDGSSMAKEIARLSDGRYFKIDHGDALDTPVQLQEVMKFDNVLDIVSMALVDPDLKGIVFKKEDRETVTRVLEFLDSLAIEFKAVSDCQSGCDPGDPDAFCYSCRLKYGDVSGEGLEIPSTLRTYPIVSLDSMGTKEELMGEIFVRFLSTPSYLNKVNRGILFIKDIDLLEPEVAEILVDALRTREYTLEKNGMRMTFPTKFTVVGTLNGKENESLRKLKDQITIMVDTDKEEDLEYRTKYIQYQKDFDADPANFEARLDRKRRERVFEIIKARKILPDVNTPELLDLAIEQMGAELSDEDCFPPKLKSLARIIAAKKLNTEVSEREAVEAIEMMRRQERLRPGNLRLAPHMVPFIKIAESVAEAEIVRDKIVSMLVAKDEIGGLMIKGFDEDAVRTALRSLQDMNFNILVPEGCKVGCDPERPSSFCASCRLKFENDELELGERPMPIVFLPRNIGLKHLKGEIFVNYVVSPNLLTRANRGIVFIEDIDELSPEVADAMAQVMSTGKNTLEKGSVIVENPCRVLVVATTSEDDAEIHPIIMNHMAAIIEASDEDRTLKRLKSLQYLEEFGTNPEMFSEMVLRSDSVNVKAVQEGQEIIGEVSISDAQLDLIARICNEFGVEGNSTEFNVEKVAKTLTAVRGEKRVNDRDIITAARMVIPLASLSSEEMQNFISKSLREMVLQHA